MEDLRKGQASRTAFDSPTFDNNAYFEVKHKVGSASISPSGRDIALASTEGLDIIDLDSPSNPPRHLRRGQPWLVADVQWSPFASRDYWVVSTANQNALVWNLNMQEDSPQGAIEHTLQAHTRAITDINFSAHHPDMLATCAVDGYVHCWDLRRPRKPVLTFVDWFAGATQVKYNRQDEHILASSHDRWLRIWDDRKGAAPLRSINAHESKIYGVDWNRTRSTGVVTCSLDKTIKFWDYGNDLDEPERVIRTDFPVWRARHTPFGWGLLAMPQNDPGNLHLYERRLTDGSEKDAFAKPVATFEGHGDDKVKEFLWRTRGGITDDGTDNREFQLVSWGEDQRLRLHTVGPQVLADVGYVRGSQVRKKLTVTRKGAVYKTFRAVEKPSLEKKTAAITAPRPGSAGMKISALSGGLKKRLESGDRGAPMMNYAWSRVSAMKGKDKSAKGGDENQKQIAWMGGVKLTKTEHSSPTKRPTSRRLSLLHPDFDQDREWDSPENLHEEIVRINLQLPNITLENIDMDKRAVDASMNGPWGENGDPIFTKVTITFPEQYPDSKPPMFSVGKTSLMPEEVYSKLNREIKQIADGFASRKQGCLEATLCYLLGEVDLDQSTTFFKDVDDLDDDLNLADQSSSDDDDDAGAIPGATTVMSQDLGSSATGIVPAGTQNASVPLPRYCGARFSTSGKLACFFPPKEEKVKSLLDTRVNRNNGRPKGDSGLETFGRLNNNSSPNPKPKTTSIFSGDKTESEESDESDVSDSDDSESSYPYRGSRFPRIPELFQRGRPEAWKRSPTVTSQRSSAAGTGTATGTGTGTGRGRSSKPKNILCLHDVSYLLPSKIELAHEYAIFGDGPDVCEHNALVAEKHGFQDLADVWRYASMLLHNDVPLEVLDQTQELEPILVIARSAAKRNRRNSGSDSGVDLSYDLHGRTKSLTGRVKWGTNPLAAQLIHNLFEYFESRADRQMLAMLSCVFTEPAANDAPSQMDMIISQPQTPLPMKTPAFSLDYFPTDAAAWSVHQKTPVNSGVSTPKLAQTPSGLYGSSTGSSTGAWGSDPASASYSCGETPPLRSSRASSEKLHPFATQSLSTSPENPRGFKRANSASLASSFAASFGRPFSLTMSSSPPNPPSIRKRPSPVESFVNSLAPSAVTWGPTSVLGSVKEHHIEEKDPYSDDEDVQSDQEPTICTGISLTMENLNVFDDDGCMSTPLLDTSKHALYASYRRSYAQLLYFWGCPLARLEILKFNGLKDYFHEDNIPDTKTSAASIISTDTRHASQAGSPPSPLLVLGKKDVYPYVPPNAELGLDVTGYCLIHESRLDPLPSSTLGGATGRCERCKFTQSQLRCTICQQPLTASFVPCLSCGCATHNACLASQIEQGEELQSCAGGCDCDCTSKASAGIVESWEVMMGAIERMRAIDASKHVTPFQDKGKQRQHSLEDWDESVKDDWAGDRLTEDSPAVSGLGRGNLNMVLGKRMGMGKEGWGIGMVTSSGVQKKASSLRNFYAES